MTDDRIRAKGQGLSRVARRQLRHYERAVDAMSPIEREVFLGHVVDGLGYAELAAKLGIDVGEVEEHFGRALAAISEVP